MQKNIKNQKKLIKKRKLRLAIKSDALFKRIMQEEVAAKEFLEYYLPKEFKELIDLSKIRIEKESFVEEGLKRRLSDIIYSVKTKENEEAFVYVLIESQSTADYWISFRLWKYMLLLLERHMKDKNRLPLIAPLLVYNGTKKYDSPRNLWDLFIAPEQARKLMTEDYRLVDLQSMPDDEIKKKQHLGMLEYFLKHIHQRDMLKLWGEFLEEFKEVVLIDKANGYIYLKQFIWYTDAKVPEKRKQLLEQLIKDNLSKEDTDNIMRTIADSYIEEGFNKGLVRGIEKGREEGIQAGMEKAASNMLKSNLDLKFISSVTGLPIEILQKLKASL